MVSDPILQFFAFEHLPQPLQSVSKPFGQIAIVMVMTLPDNPERAAGLRKLLEAKDCAVRSILFRADGLPAGVERPEPAVYAG